MVNKFFKLLPLYSFTSNFYNNILEEEFELVGRVIKISKKSYTVLTEKLETTAIMKGSLYHSKDKSVEQLAYVGDFVVLNKKPKENEIRFIKTVLPRKNLLRRKSISKQFKEQVFAANIDYVFITASADEQFNLKKIERMVISSNDCNITSVIVITKIDICENITKLIENIKANFPNINIITTSYLKEDSIIPIKNLLKNNKTGIFIGSSGAGKSTLINMLLEENIQKTQQVSEKESKGKHTTTSREIFLLKSGGCIIDTPGIKEFGIWFEDSSLLDKNFEDIVELATKCKFKNCTHTSEVGCNIIYSINNNILNKERYLNYLKLKSEEIKYKKVQEKKFHHKHIKKY